MGLKQENLHSDELHYLVRFVGIEPIGRGIISTYNRNCECQYIINARIRNAMLLYINVPVDPSHKSNERKPPILSSR